MAVGSSQPTVVASKDGRIGMKNQMQVALGLFWLSSFHINLFYRIRENVVTCTLTFGHTIF